MTTVFLYATPLAVLAFALTWLLREIPLRQSPSGPAAAPAPV
ncbi:MAG: hypothetical protein ACT4OS_07075 [Acidimicrobiales bacterium]